MLAMHAPHLRPPAPASRSDMGNGLVLLSQQASFVDMIKFLWKGRYDLNRARIQKPLGWCEARTNSMQLTAVYAQPTTSRVDGALLVVCHYHQD